MVFQTHNWTSCRATENQVPLCHLMQQTMWTLTLLYNRPSANERKFNNNTKNRLHSQQTTICSPIPWQQPSRRPHGSPQKSSWWKQFYSQVIQAIDAFIKKSGGKWVCTSSKEILSPRESPKAFSLPSLAFSRNRWCGLCDLAAFSFRVTAAMMVSGFWVAKLESPGALGDPLHLVLNSFPILCSCSVQESQVGCRLSGRDSLELGPTPQGWFDLWALGKGFLQGATGLTPSFYSRPFVCSPASFTLPFISLSSSQSNPATTWTWSHHSELLSPCGPACSASSRHSALLFCLSSELHAHWRSFHSSWRSTCSSPAGPGWPHPHVPLLLNPSYTWLSALWNVALRLKNWKFDFISCNEFQWNLH